jgi:hypothetical protein
VGVHQLVTPKKDMWEPKETEKKEKHIISDHSRKELEGTLRK